MILLTNRFTHESCHYPRVFEQNPEDRREIRIDSEGRCRGMAMIVAEKCFDVNARRGKGDDLLRISSTHASTETRADAKQHVDSDIDETDGASPLHGIATYNSHHIMSPPQLPTELVVIIAEFLAVDLALGSLAQLNLATRTIHQETLPVLFETVAFEKKWWLKKREIKGWKWIKCVPCHVVVRGADMSS